MKRLLQLALILLVSFALTGCPYESTVPIDKPAVKFPENLFGKWEPKNSGEELFTIKKKNDWVVYISKTKKDPKPEDSPEEYEAFLSEVNAVWFLNVSNKTDKSSPESYCLYKMQVAANGSQITLSAVTENIDEQFSNSAELKAFIEKNMQLSFFFDNEEDIYLRPHK
ncbi:hypothetical protein ESA94_09060 [Lacibacter luteus]|uniref:Lipocalin-like domain-containing protein n=1 Tax=Lacibacter luteus TaxID=2508719 RepID=A0A4Q1CJU4_9BACT|nr:hypothetical protein [Lacibacter luteus]RXK60602.1 hypothetical protein ESA94_09060 [Lacibacter luteus]